MLSQSEESFASNLLHGTRAMAIPVIFVNTTDFYYLFAGFFRSRAF
jgi:hypothetical protein